SAMAWPIPRAAPVTRLTVLERSHFMGLLDERTERLQKARGRRAVHDAVIESQAQGDAVARHDLIADDCRLALDPTDAEDAALAVVKDRREGVDAERAEVGDGERAAAHFVDIQLAGPGPLDESARSLGQLLQRERWHIANHGHQQARLGVHGNADVN